MSDFVPAAWRVKRARAALEQWNAENPDRKMPWEWVEEALYAWRGWKEMVSYAPTEAEAAREKYEGFARRLPRDLRREIWPQA